MISFFLTLHNFIMVIINGLKNNDEFRFLFIFVFLLITGSTLFFTHFEGWSIIDSIYFSVMTMATIGYGDFAPTTPFTKIFTVIFTFLSVGAFVALAASFLQLNMEARKNKKKKS